MKKLIILIIAILATTYVKAQVDTIFIGYDVCPNEDMFFFPSPWYEDSLFIVEYQNNSDTVIGDYVILATTDSITTYTIKSNNSPSYILCVTLTPYNNIPTFTILTESIHHVSCPGGHDGSFSIRLDTTAENYQRIVVNTDNNGFVFYDDFTISNLSGGMYKIIARGINGCEYIDSVWINPSPPAWSFDYENAIIENIRCNEPGTIYFANQGGTPPYNYEWHLNSDWSRTFPDTSHLSVTDPGCYWCWITDSNNCLVMDAPIFVDIYQIMVDTISLLGPSSACYGDTVNLTAWSRGHGDYRWNCEDTTMYVSHQLFESTLFSVVFTDQNGCITEDSLWIDVHHPQISLTEVPEHCQNDVPFDINGYVTATPAGGTLYFNGIGNMVDGVISQLDSGENTIYVFYQEGGCYAYDTLTFEVVVPEIAVLEVPAFMVWDNTYTLTLPYAGGRVYMDAEELVVVDGQVDVVPDVFSPGMHTLYYVVDSVGEYGCLSEWSVQVEIRDGVGVADFGGEVRLYPNPARERLTVDVRGMRACGVQLVDMQGRTVKSQSMDAERDTLEVSDIAPGVYFVRVIFPNGTLTKKFVKE